MNVNAAKKTSFVLAASAALLLAASGAQAHARLVSADPAPNATVASPTAISLRFNEPFEPKFSGFELSMGDGMVMAMAPVGVADHDKTLTAVISTPLKPGAYRITWHAVGADDGHRTQGAYVFTAR